MTDATPDLRSYFGLTALPFTRELDSRDRFYLPTFDESLAHLLRAVENRMSAAIIAPSGTGKTMLLRAIRDHLPEARYRVHDVKVTSLSKRDMCREISTAVGLPPVGTYPNLLRKLQDLFTAQAFDEGLRPVLLIDEAQDMRPEVLATLRILTNFDLDSRLVLSVVLAGDNGLGQLLARHDLEPVRRRLAHVATLPLMSRDQATGYLDHRLTLAGATTSLFADDAKDAVYEIARGNLRATDHLCLKALELAAASDRRQITASLVATSRTHLLI